MNARLFFILYAILTQSCSNKPEPSDNKKSNALIYNNYATSILEFEGVFPENPLILLSHSKAIRMFLSTKQKAEKINLDEGLYKFYNHWIYLTNGFNITVTLTPDNKNNRYHIRGSGKRENTILAGFIKETDAFIFSEIVFGNLLAHPINKFWEKLELFSEILRNMLLDTSLNQKFVEDQQKNIN